MGMTLITVVLGTWIGLAGAGGGLYLLAKSGKVSFGTGSGARGPDAKATRSITLEPIVVNLADPGGHAFVRLGLRVEILGDAAAAPAEEAAPAKGTGAAGGLSDLDGSIRDTTLEVLGRQTSADLLGPDGKEHLKIELRDAIGKGSSRVDVKDVFFTDFLVQI